MAETKMSKDAQENKVTAAISYLFILCFVPLLIGKDSKFVQFHAKQGLAIFIVWLLVLIVSSVPIIGWLLSGPLNLIMAIVSLVGFVMALQGKEYRMPIFYDLSEKIKI